MNKNFPIIPTIKMPICDALAKEIFKADEAMQEARFNFGSESSRFDKAAMAYFDAVQKMNNFIYNL